MIVRTYVSFLIVAATALFPYNLFMNAHEYFLYKLRNTSDIDNATGLPIIVHQTDLQRNFEGYLTVFGGIACIIGAAINLAFTAKLTNTIRVIFGYVLVVISFIPTIGLTYVNTDEDQERFFYVSLLLAATASAGSMGFIGGGILGLASKSDPIYMQGVMIGQSLAGIASSLLSIACEAFTSDDVLNGRIYFYIAIAWTLLSIFVYTDLTKNPQKMESYLSDSAEDRQVLVDNDSLAESESGTTKKYLIALSQTKLDLLCVAVVLIITLAGFPAVTSLVQSTSSHATWKKYFSSVCCFLIFNIGDGVGRLLGSATDMEPRQLLQFCLVRIIFLPVVAACNVAPRYHSPTLLPYDGVFVLTVLLFAVTHGFSMTLSIANVSKHADPDLQEIAGSIVNLVGVFFALVGSLFGVLVVTLL